VETRTVTRLLIALLAAASLAGEAAAVPTVVELPTTNLTIGRHKLVVEMATTPEQRATGLMYRFSLRPDRGMLFVFDRPERQAFWMRNTYVPLSIAFVAADGRIVNIDDMAPHDEAMHWSQAPVVYAIEMKKGWFAERGIVAGDRVEGLPPPSRR
jgi:uncharacterized membrane protein (UPF0127 family)